MDIKTGCFGLKTLGIRLSFLTILVIFTLFLIPSHFVTAQDEETKFTKEFRLEDCNFISEGENAHFILKPGYQLVLQGEEEGKTVRFLMAVLPETREISVPGIGMVKTRVVQEKEWADGKPIEQAKSFFAICEQTKDVYDFGDEVEVFNEDGSISNEGTWHAGEPDKEGVAMPGIFMPGTFLLGARYYQQLADGFSMERGENVEMGMTVTTDAGNFENCVKVLETNTVESDAETEKTHCPGIGLVGEDNLKLVKYGFNVVDENGL